MLGATLGLPEQFDQARRSAVDVAGRLEGLPGGDDLDAVVVVGMGGSGIGGDVLDAIGSDRLTCPLVVSKEYAIPAFVGPRTLMIGASFSGNTEETLEAITGAEAAGAPWVAVTAGGELGQRAADAGRPVFPVDGTIPMPRAGIAALSVPPIVLLEQLGVLPGAGDLLDAASAQLHRRRDALAADDREIVRLAAHIDRTVPLVYGGGHVGRVAAVRWKNQVNENAKAPAFAHWVPELMHNEICGFGQHGDMTRQVFSLIELRHSGEHSQISRRFQLLRPLMDEVVNDRFVIEAQGDGPLAQLFDLVLFGDLWSLHLAYNEGVDPGPIPVLMDLKAALAQGR
jgi:glucose/mannose-6-phosphate isomerase